MRKACEDWSLGYDQNQRWNIYDGGECDCSSLVIWALKQAGFDVGSATYTGNMSSNLTARGWKRIPFTSLSQVRAGDILLNDSYHTAAVISGSGTTAKLAQASIDERGRATGGQAGDQTGRETNIRTVYNYSHGWDCILRYSEADSGQGGTNAQKLEIDGYLGALSVSEWQRQRGTYVDAGREALRGLFCYHRRSGKPTVRRGSSHADFSGQCYNYHMVNLKPVKAAHEKIFCLHNNL